MNNYNQSREYTNKIDFSRSCKEWGLRGILSYHIKCENLNFHLGDLFDKGILKKWQFTIRPSFNGYNHYIILESCTRIDEDLDKSLKCILNYLQDNKITIIYKEGEFGYNIDATGNILKKWDLDDGMC